MLDSSASSPFWLSAFLDLAPEGHAPGVEFWSAVTGYAVSPPRGVDGEFTTLLPPTGDDYLRIQRLGSGSSRLHLDLHVHEPGAAADRAVSLGATVVDRPDPGSVVLRSPGGLTFCLVSHRGAEIPAPGSWPGVRRSRVYLVCLDIPAASYDAECGFWAGLVGGTAEVLPGRPEFAWLRGPRRFALVVLLQRLGDETGEVTAHLDLGTSDRAAEVARHLVLGAVVRAEEESWTVLTDPAGLAYCVTDRDPATGGLP